MRDNHNNKGFTLVELVVCMAILALIVVGIAGIMSSNNVIFRKTKADINVQEIALDTYTKLDNDLMQARNVYVEGYVLDSKLTFKPGEHGTSLNTGVSSLPAKQGFVKNSDLYIKKSVSVGTYTDYADLLTTVSKMTDTQLENKRKLLSGSNLSEFNLYYNKVRYMDSTERGFYNDFLTYIDANNTVSGTYKSFDELVKADGTLKNLYVTKIIIQYYVPVNHDYVTTTEDYDTCYVTYTFNKNEVQISTKYGLMTSLNTTNAVYTDSLNYACVAADDDAHAVPAVLAKVDGANDSIEFEINFSKNSMKYVSNGISNIRNSYVLHDAK